MNRKQLEGGGSRVKEELSQYPSGGNPRKIRVRIAGVPAEIGTKHISKASQEKCCLYSSDCSVHFRCCRFNNILEKEVQYLLLH